jgi:hypothetical protein
VQGVFVPSRGDREGKRACISTHMRTVWRRSGWGRMITFTMALLSGMIRTVAITGRTDTINAWFASRQGGRWAEQTIRDAFPRSAPHAQRTQPAVATRPPADPDETLRELTELHERGVLTDAEFEDLRTRPRV